jgi:hypothetical protein
MRSLLSWQCSPSTGAHLGTGCALFELECLCLSGCQSLLGKSSVPTEVQLIGRLAACGDDIRIIILVQIAEGKSVHRPLPVPKAYWLEAAPGPVVAEGF